MTNFMTTRTRLTALALAAAALSTATMLDGSASAKPALGSSVGRGSTTSVSNIGNGTGNTAALRRAAVLPQHAVAGFKAARVTLSPGTVFPQLPVTATCGLFNCSPAPPPGLRTPPSPPLGDPGGSNGGGIGTSGDDGGGAGGGDAHSCMGDRDCGIFRQN
jgi:hypothetical protein